MKKKDIIEVCLKDQKRGNGEILDITNEELVYYSFYDDAEVTFRYAECCSDEYVKNLIHIGSGATKQGLTKDYIVNVLKKAFGQDYFDAIVTMSGIIIPSNEEEFYQMLDETIRTGDNAKEWYDYEEEFKTCCGRMLTQHQIAVINEKIIASESEKMEVEEHQKRRTYQIGLVITLIHEVRHLMLDTNPFLPEDEFPDSLATEDKVEEFARDQYEQLGELRFFA